ncbi:small acid-soluble spore protein Tlp [Paenibacillus sp. sptzw28]|uniref:small acid-soluble spore protein Tlp n=1 Tax=Paenibacillus sp. sptzw28 TaxID=715179 RepID=UPI001C6E5A46|nr:small acid-soluble spore protein Tlp [Paenibacillus sp. sptzw28]QYR23811.1 small acid-soluble spore protein Tlp [Paenibacillus sp. sptzw28]
MAHPDNREDNVSNLQNAIENTEENMNEAEEYLNEHADEISSEEQSNVESKNARRSESIEGLTSEMRDEQEFQEEQE